MERKKQEEKAVRDEKMKLNRGYEATILEQKEFIKILKKYRNDESKYKKIVLEREQNIEDLKDSLSYPSFTNPNMEKFFKIWELGHLISISKPAVERHLKELSALLTWLCNEKIDISTRYDEALNGKYKVEGISKAFISKVLVIHQPKLYYVKNKITEAALKKYGIQIPRGLSEGEKYKITSKFLCQICEDTDIDNLAVLDYYLYLEGQ